MKIKDFRINSIEDFISYIETYRNENKIRIYRGQEENWALDSKLLRLVKETKKITDFYKIEKRIFNEFKNRFIEFKDSSNNYNDWHILSLGQHYGLPTRLIDWTSDPLIALWFAFENQKDNENDRIVWGLVVDNDLIVDFNKDSPFRGRFIKVFEPHKIDNRIENQQSWFSIQNIQVFGKGDGDGLPVFNEYNTMNERDDFEYYLARFIFKNSLRFDILEKLEELGVNYLKIFPDLTGLCKLIEWKELKQKLTTTANLSP